MKTLVIDDLRIFRPDSYPDTEVVYARTPEDGVSRLREGNWICVYLDHDLGYAGDVKPCLDYILEFRDEFPDTLFVVHTSNAYERDSMVRQLNARNLLFASISPVFMFNVDFSLMPTDAQ